MVENNINNNTINTQNNNIVNSINMVNKTTQTPPIIKVKAMQFLLNYNGTKYQESKYLHNINLTKYNTIIEAFGGSFGYIRYLWGNNYEAVKNKNFIVYDNNPNLINFYNHIKHLISVGEIQQFLTLYNKYNTNIFNGSKTIKTKFAKSFINGSMIHTGNKQNDIALRFMLNNNIFTATGICRPSGKVKVKFEAVDFTQYESDKTLIYLDPPYLAECNTFYANVDDTFNYYDKLVNLFATNNCMLVHSFNGLMHYVFKQYNYMQYTKQYRNKGKIIQHIVYYSGE